MSYNKSFKYTKISKGISFSFVLKYYNNKSKTKVQLKLVT